MLRPLAPPGPARSPGVDVADVDVSVVIVTYNVREFLEQALDAVAKASAGLAVETFVVDNDSADGSTAMVAERFPDVTVIANTDNVGFATANNQAIRQAKGRYVLVLNPDTIVQEDTLRELVAFMDAHPDAGAVGPRILNPDGTFAPESRRAFPTPAVAFYRISGLGRLFPTSPRFGRYNLTHLPADQPCPVDALSGSCMMVRRDAVLARTEQRSEVPDDRSRRPAGLFDEDFFMYGEDLDWCYRIQQAGWTIHYTPSTQIVHYKGESTKKGDLRYVILFYGAMLRFVEKHVATATASSLTERLGQRALATGLRLGILIRAALAASGRLAERLAPPARDLALAWAALSVAAWGWSHADGFTFGPDYYGLVLPIYAAALVAAVGLAGGYERQRRRRRAVPYGATLAIVAVSTASFYVPSIAFSRATLLLGYAGAALLLFATRARRRRTSRRRSLLVGTADEALRLRRLVGKRAVGDLLAAPDARTAGPHVVGYVTDRPGPASDDLQHLGPIRQLRDLVRLHRADEVVFAADSLTNTTILAGMRALRDVPVHLKILASGRDRIIGKASIEDLSAPLVDAERTVAPLRAHRRLLDVPVALVLLLLGPLVRWHARRRPGAASRRRVALVAAMPDVLTGRLALVGYHPDAPHPPAAWGLVPGAASILDTLPARPETIVETHRAYWAYARHQSAGLDLEIVARALTQG